MKVIAVSVGLPAEVEWRGQRVSTAIFKSAHPGRARIVPHNLDGDRQADLSVHGGPDKAVYAYPAEHYAWWARELPEAALPWGAFGENLTTEGGLESDVCIGDRFRVGTAELAVTQPRTPCYKLAIRFGRVDMVKRFLASGRSGFYMAVVTDGDVGAGDVMQRVSRDERELSVADVARLFTARKPARALLELASSHPGLPAGWREHFSARL